MSTEEIELEGIEYFVKFKERLDIVMAYISDGRDIPENDYAVLREIHKIQVSGSLPFYKTICTDSATTTTQADLFSDNTTGTIHGYPDGTQFDFVSTNKKNKKK